MLNWETSGDLNAPPTNRYYLNFCFAFYYRNIKFNCNEHTWISYYSHLSYCRWNKYKLRICCKEVYLSIDKKNSSFSRIWMLRRRRKCSWCFKNEQCDIQETAKINNWNYTCEYVTEWRIATVCINMNRIYEICLCICIRLQ